jgi:hypothetical protein
MKRISHRGNLFGPKPAEENTIAAITVALAKGFDVELDIHYNEADKNLYLGHDLGQYGVSVTWLEQYKKNLWIHCKNIAALQFFSQTADNFHYFWHQNDDYTLTSQQIIWAYPGQPHTTRAVIVMPERISTDALRAAMQADCYGVCSDYIGQA